MKRAPHITVLNSLLALLVFGLVPAVAFADIRLEVAGLEEEVTQNVEAHVLSGWTLHPSLDSRRRRDAFLTNVRDLAAKALRPWGYYEPVIDSRLEHGATEGSWVLWLDISAGPPVRVEQASIEVTGPGASEPAFMQWRAGWPLDSGQVLDQVAWEKQKSQVMELAQSLGYLQAAFTTRRIALDLERNRADLFLHLETGAQAVMGEVAYLQDEVDPEVLAPMARFRPGEPYQADRIDDLRLDLWRTGYFSEIEVTEHPRENTSPAVVDVHARLTGRHRTTHQVTLGFGTDTRFRTQYNWTRHRLSHRGDSLSAALGWRQRYSEIIASAEYRLPRRVEKPQFWIASGTLRRENQSFIARPEGQQEPVLLAEGEVLDSQLRGGRLRFFDTPVSSDRIAETTFIALLRETDHLQPVPDISRLRDNRDRLEDLLGQTTLSVSIGMEWDWSVIRDRGFATNGFHHRAWWFTANEAWGSDKDFSQAYLSMRWNRLFGDRWKLLLRGEIGYSDARIRDFEINAGGDSATVSVTELPYRYSFRAGGSQSVRGYGYERLSNNGVGSNHLLVGSAELEYRLLGDWAVAGFYDIGNAFNDWSEPDLKRGWGFGVRWYSIIGSIRADFGRAEDIAGNPWEFYLTIGTPLL